MGMIHDSPVFRKPSFFEQILNKGFGVLVGLGIGLRHNYLLQVAGRKRWVIHPPVLVDPLERQPWGGRADEVAASAEASNAISAAEPRNFHNLRPITPK